MSEIRDRIVEHKAQIESDFGFELATIQAQVADPGYSICKHKAFCQLEQEIIATINAQVLNQWLIDNEIPEEYYDRYAYVNGVLLFNREAVEDE